MKIVGFVAMALTLSVSQPSSAQITAEEAQSLPEDELAHRVLGGLAHLVLKVHRPAWSTFDWSIPHTGAPPLHFMDFDLRASDHWTDGWSGVCQAQRITVFFDTSGKVDRTDMSLLTGVAGPLRRTSLDESKSVRLCAALTTVDGFFYSTAEPYLSEATIPAVQLIAESLWSEGRLPFPLTCRPVKALASCRAQDWKFDVNDIDMLLELACTKEDAPDARTHCYEVSLARRVRGAPSYRFSGIHFVVKDKGNAEAQIVRAQLWVGQGMTELAF